jgi:hypothetical protein
MSEHFFGSHNEKSTRSELNESTRSNYRTVTKQSLRFQMKGISVALKPYHLSMAQSTAFDQSAIDMIDNQTKLLKEHIHKIKTHAVEQDD